MNEQKVLLREENYYLSKKEELLQEYDGQFIIIKSEDIRGPFPTWEEAFRAGIKEFGNIPMLIKQVVRKEPTIRLPSMVSVPESQSRI